MNIKEAHAFACDMWKFYKDHADVQSSDEYWQAVIMDATDLDKRYGSRPAVKQIILAVINVLEEEEKKL